MKADRNVVLVVDDIDYNRDVLVRHVERLGYAAIAANNGRQALELMRSQEFDLVLLDIIMPEMDGYQVLEHLRADPTLSHIPVLIISAVDELHSAVRCIELGAEDYLTKPFNSVLLKARIQASLEKKRLRDLEQALLEELSFMQYMDRELNATLNLSHVLHITLAGAVQRSGADAGLAGVIEPGGLRILAVQGHEAELAAYQNKLLELAVIQNEPSPNPTGEDRFGFLAAAQSRAMIPIRQGEQVIGVIWLESRSPDRFTPDVLAFLNRLSDRAAIAISNAQLYAAVEAANIAKSEFVSLVSHELKSPMTAIKGYAQMLADGTFGPVNDEQIEFLNTIEHNVDYMAALVADLADISRIEAGRLRLEFSAIPFTQIVESVMRPANKWAEDGELALTLRMADDLPPVWGDRTRLIQILTNLVNNACKYTSPGGQVTICAEHTANQWDPQGAPEVVHVSVQDTGLGIRPEDQGGIFQKFFRAGDPEVRLLSGTGLGLSIAKYLVEMQGGRIWFESEFRHGSTFHFTIPVASTGQEG